MMVVWLLVLAILLYAFRALSRPKVHSEEQESETAQDDGGAASLSVRTLPRTVGGFERQRVYASSCVTSDAPELLFTATKVGAEPAMAGVAEARKVAPSEIEPLPMTPTKQKEEDGLPKEPQTPTTVGWRPDSPAPSESALSADTIGLPGPRTLSLQSSPSGSHTVDAMGLTPATPRSLGDAHTAGDDVFTVAPSDAGSVYGGDDQVSPKTSARRMLSGKSFKLKMGRTQSDAERLARAQAKQAAELERVARNQEREAAADAERVARIQQKEAAAEARSSQRLAAAQALLAEKEAARHEAEMHRQAVLAQLAQVEKRRQVMWQAQATVDRANNTSALMDQVARQQAARQRMQEHAAARAYANGSAKA